MDENNHIPFISTRFYFVLGLIFFVALGLMARIFELTILHQKFLKHQGDERVLRLIKTPAFRGIIEDRNGFPLAVSTSVFSIWINPQEFNPDATKLSELEKLIQLSATEIQKIAKRQKQNHKEFAYLKRGLPPNIMQQVKLLQIPGIYGREEYRRFYPEGEIMAHIIGFTNIDDEGQEGLELGYNQWLRGSDGKKWVIKDRLGRIIDDIETVEEQKPGNNLTLSIDRRLQFIAYRELLTGIHENKAKSGSVVILDVKTGEILAMVNLPSYNPNRKPNYVSEAFRNRAVTDTFEPGSTIKAFTVASGLESGKFKMNSVVDTSPGRLRFDKNEVKDEKDNGVLTLSKILQVSSNVGAAKIVLNIPANQLWNLLHRVGFGEITGIGFPGEQSGTLIKHDPWGSFVLATLSFGYGLSVTPLQLARAYAVLANDGIKIPISLLKTDKVPNGERVLSSNVAKQMLLLLETVTNHGSGKSAKVPGYRVAGKSGTAKIVGKSGYESHHYYSSFVGMAPIDNPRLIVAVIINDPRGKNYYGGMVSGPVFGRIMQSSLHLLMVPPDQTLDKNV